MSKILDRIANGEILVSDGALGTFLQAKGLKPGECPEAWCVTHSDIVKDIAEAYVSAGSDMVSTNSFGGTHYKLKEYGLTDKVSEFNTAAARIVKAAVGTEGYVLGSIGPTGQIVEDEGGFVSESELFNAYKDQVIALASGGADLILAETMSSVMEAAQAIKAAKAHTNLPVACTFTFELGARGFRTMMGVDPVRAAEEAIEAGADIVGANCGNGIANMVEIVKQMHAAVPNIPILVQANAGAPVLEDGKTVFKETPEDMASRVKELVEAGAKIIGGCCGTTPDHIRAIVATLAK